MNDFQERCGRWVAERFPNDTLDRRLAKLLEEAGEFARACVALQEGRPGRGDPAVEGAQIVLVLLSTFRNYGLGDLFTEVERELIRVENDPTSHRKEMP